MNGTDRSIEAGRDLVVGVDVGGTKIAAIAVGPGASLLGRSVRPIPADPSVALVDAIAAAVRDVVEPLAGGLRRVRAVGLAMPGRVDPGSGHVRLAVNLAHVDEPIAARLSEALGVPCVVENDVRAAALGIQRFGLDLAARDMAYLNVGTGIAAGIVLDGSLHRGRHGMAGEIGHVVLDPAGPRCRCGLHGCAEAIAAGPAIAREGQARIRASVLEAHGDGHRPVASAVLAAAAAGDADAVAVVDEVSAALARVIHGLVMSYDLDRVVIGGGVSRSGATFLEPILAQLERSRGASPLAREVLRADLVRLVPPDFDAGCWGAVALLDDASWAMATPA